MITNYAQLIAAISANLKRDDITDQYSTFVQFAEARFNRTLRLSEMETRATSMIYAGEEYAALPTDFLALRDIQINYAGKTISLEYLAPNRMNDINSGASGVIAYYTIIDYQIQVAPLPIADTQIEVVYYAKIPALETATSNWLLSKSPDVYLWGALVEAEAYLVNDKRIGIWKARMDEALNELRQADASLKWGASPLQMRASSPTP